MPKREMPPADLKIKLREARALKLAAVKSSKTWRMRCCAASGLTVQDVRLEHIEVSSQEGDEITAAYVVQIEAGL